MAPFRESMAADEVSSVTSMPARFKPIVSIAGLLGCALVLAGAVPGLRAAPMVAIHDSELTRALESVPATNSTTPVGPGTTGFEWWPTNWHYFVMPESLQEALRSDGTACQVVSDADISAGHLLDTNGQPSYPIVISLASEAIGDDEVGPLTNYVAAGGVLLVGSSAFTRFPNGAPRGDFALAGPMGVHAVNGGLRNWAPNATFSRITDHPLVSHIPAGTLTWRMPSAAEEIPWGISPDHTLPGYHLIWQVQPSDATVIAQGDTRPYLLIKPFGKGMFIYHAGMQPLIGHSGFAPGMYAYGLFRNAIQWAFASANIPIPKVSPWPYPYDAALNVRHDFEDYQDMINSIEASARFEYTNGAKGDYYFCTGALREDMTNSPATIASLQRAVTNYGATIGPHNGGLPNPRNPSLVLSNYDYWHWGPDEALDVTPAGYADGKTYALTSLTNAFADVEGWLAGITNGLRAWVAPYFNATRENSYNLQAQAGVTTAGEQKLGPFPHWTFSAQASGKRYSFVSLPVSDWYIGSDIAQAMESGHSVNTIHALVDFYYTLGVLINLYSHSSSDGRGQAGPLVQEYIRYSLAKPRVWPANSADVYSWWVRRAATQIIPNSTTSGNQSITTLAITGADDPQTAVELFIPQPSFSGLQVFTNGVPASGDSFRTNGQVVKLWVGTSVTNAEIRYTPTPTARNDAYSIVAGTTLAVATPGVLANDSPGMGNPLTAVLVTGPTNGTLTLNSDGSFSYIPTTNYSGADSFTYKPNDGFSDGNAATVSIFVISGGPTLFADDFTRETDPGPLSPWIVQSNNWTVTGGQLLGGTNSPQSYGFVCVTSNWTDYAVQARIRFPAGAFGGGLGGRLNPATGAHYAAWIYPEGSPAGSRVLELIKFQSWSSFGYTNVASVPMREVTLPAVGTNWHTLKLSFEGNQIAVYYDGTEFINTVDMEAQPYSSGGISVDMWTEAMPYVMAVDGMMVTPPRADQITTFAPLANQTYGSGPFTLNATASSGLPVTFSILSGPATINGNTLTVTGAGTVTVRASQAGDASYNPAPDVDQSFAVAPAVLTITADNQSMVYGASIPALTASFSGFVNGEDASVLCGSPQLNTPAGANSPAGLYPISVQSGTLSSSNYTFQFISGALTILATPEGLLFADDFTRPLNPGALPPWVAKQGAWAVINGLLQGSGIPNSYSYAYVGSTWADYSVEAQIQFSSVAGWGGGLGGRLNPVTGAHYGAWAYPEGSQGGSAILRLVKFETWTGWSGTPMAQVHLPAVGTNWHGLKLAFLTNQIAVYFDGLELTNVTDNGFDSQPPYLSGGISAELYTDSSASYMLSVSNVLAKINKPTLIISADNASRPYGATNPAFTGTIVGLANGDNISASYTTVADTNSPVGTYLIVPAAIDPDNRLTNYFLSLQSGTLTVTPALLTVTADNESRIYGAPNPAFTVQYSGLVNSETEAVLSGNPELGTTAAADSSVAGSPYAITVGIGTLSATNYTFALVNGELAITPADSAIAVSSSANPSPTGSNVTVTATLTAVPPGSGTPGGTVQFVADGLPLGGPVPVSGGIASLNTAALVHGYHTLAVEYAGDSNFDRSTNTLSPNQLVNTPPVAGTVALSAVQNEATNLSTAQLIAACTDADNDALSIASVSPASARGGTISLKEPASLTGGLIIYLPPTDYTGADSFTYIVSDSFGAATTGTVAIVVSPAMLVPPTIYSLTRHPDGNMELRCSGGPGQTYRILAGASLSRWQDISTNTADADGLILFVDLNATNQPVRFYRLTAP